MGKTRSFVIALVDGANNDCVIVKRDLGNNNHTEIEVQAPPGNVVGFVRRETGVIHKKFLLLDTMRQPVLKIKAPVRLNVVVHAYLFRQFCMRISISVSGSDCFVFV